MESDHSNNPPTPVSPDRNSPRTSKNEDFPPISIPDHTLIRAIGKGSYGTVWLARNIMGVYRAVKVVYRKTFGDAVPYNRELSGIRKFEPISRSHEGFVDILHVGIKEDQSAFYYVMELGDDQNTGQTFDSATYVPKTLGKEIALRGKLPFQECLQLGIALSDALGELHKHGLVHRDVKPSNIIFVNGVPKLADIGLVAGVHESLSYVGTQGFIPPEGPGTPQADIYSLGKVLYEASTGKDRLEFPELPTALESLDDQAGFLELNEVMLQACKNDIRKRYQSAWDMHTDLLIIAKGKSVKRLKELERRLGQAKRLTWILLLFLAVLAVIGIPVYRAYKAENAARLLQVGERLSNGNRLVDAGDLIGALPYYAEALRVCQSDADEEPVHRQRLSATISCCPKLTQMWSLGKQVRDGEFSPDGKRVVVALYHDVAQVFDVETGELCSKPFISGTNLMSAVFSPDNQSILLGRESRKIIVLDANTLQIKFELMDSNRQYSAKFAPDGLRFVTSGIDGVVRVWANRAGETQPQFALRQHKGTVKYSDFSHNGQLIVTAGQDGTALLWNARNGKPTGIRLEHKGGVYYAAFSPDDAKIVTASSDRKARIWEVATGKLLAEFDHVNMVNSSEFSPDGRLLLTTCMDGNAYIRSADDGQPLFSNLILRHGIPIMHGSFSPDGRRIITTCADGTVRIWDLSGCGVVPVPTQLPFSEDGGRFVKTTNDTLKIFSSSPEKELCSLSIPPSAKSVKLNRNGHFLISATLGSTNCQIKVWNVSGTKASECSLQIPNTFTNFSLSDDGSRLVASSQKGAQTWNVSTGKPLSPMLLYSNRDGSAFLSPDGQRLVLLNGKTAILKNALTGADISAPLTSSVPFEYVAFNSNGNLLVTCCRDRQATPCCAQVWNAVTGHPFGPQLWHKSGVVSASFSPDSKRIITTGLDHEAIVRDIPPGRRPSLALQHKGNVLSAEFSSDGKWIITVCDDNTVRIWNSTTGYPLTLPIRYPGAVKRARFLSDGIRAIISDIHGNSWFWEFPRENRPDDDLRKIASLISNGELLSPDDDALIAESSDTLWKRLRRQYPASFSVSPGETEAWHEFEAEQSEFDHQWNAVLFHLRYLLTNRANDEALLKRIAEVKQKVKADF